jgi:hypothetical protein
MSPEEVAIAEGTPATPPHDGDALDTLGLEPKTETPSDKIPVEPAVQPEVTPEGQPAEPVVPAE